eukprot:Ihof_evm23s20 gene=Ihof_evmTU23s20
MQHNNTSSTRRISSEIPSKLSKQSALLLARRKRLSLPKKAMGTGQNNDRAKYLQATLSKYLSTPSPTNTDATVLACMTVGQLPVPTVENTSRIQSGAIVPGEDNTDLCSTYNSSHVVPQERPIGTPEAIKAITVGLQVKFVPEGMAPTTYSQQKLLPPTIPIKTSPPITGQSTQLLNPLLDQSVPSFNSPDHTNEIHCTVPALNEKNSRNKKTKDHILVKKKRVAGMGAKLRAYLELNHTEGVRDMTLPMVALDDVPIVETTPAMRQQRKRARDEQIKNYKETCCREERERRMARRVKAVNPTEK